MKGRHKPGAGHYYAAHMKPTVPINPEVGVSSKHPDYDFQSIGRLTTAQYEADLQKVRASTSVDEYTANRKATGISKPSIISGLVPRLTLSPPRCFTVDLMHHLYNNIPTLFISLWRGTMKCDPTDSKENWFWVCLTGTNWTEHGLDVANAGQYLPALFHRVPRNPALKISSSYKCTEYNVYFYKLGRVLFRKYLPPIIYQHYCLLVHAVDILAQRSITPEQLADAHSCLVQFVQGYEALYYQGREDRLHFCRPAIHTLLHTSPEVPRVGPGPYATQYTLENIIGDLGGEIRQPSNPYGSFKKIALRRCQMNAAKVIYPQVDINSKVRPPRGAHQADNGYVLLTPRAPRVRKTSTLGAMGDLIKAKLGMDHVLMYGRLMIPNRHYARSVYTESRYTRLTRRVCRMVKIEYKAYDANGRVTGTVTSFGEAQFYFLDSEGNAKAMVALFGPRIERIYNESHSTIWACTYPDAEDSTRLRLCNVEEIVAVVSMQPFIRRDDDYDLDGLNVWFVAEKSGLEDTHVFMSLEALNEQLETIE
ncbi:hypothetical protein NMY22_g16468 [Coprinellus aureogranulatus]|nr:hypothetical protein NMY22_g16468 [Coprinellus aureogranulatus]